jgi:hypothetical protein
MSGKSVPCANLSVSGCSEYVTERGKVHCNKCIAERTEGRKNMTIEDLLSKNKELDNKITILTSDNVEYRDRISSLLTGKNELEIKLGSLQSPECQQRYTDIITESDRKTETIRGLESELEHTRAELGDARSALS